MLISQSSVIALLDSLFRKRTHYMARVNDLTLAGVKEGNHVIWRIQCQLFYYFFVSDSTNSTGLPNITNTRQQWRRRMMDRNKYLSFSKIKKKSNVLCYVYKKLSKIEWCLLATELFPESEENFVIISMRVSKACHGQWFLFDTFHLWKECEFDRSFDYTRKEIEKKNIFSRISITFW